MNIQDVFDFAISNKVCYLATIEDGNPRIRGMMLWTADKTGFYFHTSTKKRLFSQISTNPNVEICFYKPDQQAGVQLRVRGNVEMVNDDGLKEKLLSERPFLKALGETAGNLAIFRVTNGEAFFWTMANNTNEQDVETYKF